MHAAFGTVVLVVCLGALAVGLLLLLGNRQAWEEFGRRGLVMEREQRQAPSAAGGAVVERDAEIRQMLEARNARRARRGEAPVDVEEELARLTRPSIDDELRGEIRDLVIARNHRRARRGEPPLDVDSEVARQIAELGPS